MTCFKVGGTNLNQSVLTTNRGNCLLIPKLCLLFGFILAAAFKGGLQKIAKFKHVFTIYKDKIIPPLLFRLWHD